jgi:DNA-binding LytR/AlgR family response regulator
LNNPTAIIADDEEHLRAHLRSRLNSLWPQLQIVAEAVNGLEAEAMILAHRPAVAFLDIKMPGLTGLQVAQHLEGQTRFVFVTAYDQFALEAFEREAVDFLVKPVDDERLSRTVKRLRVAIEAASPPPVLTQMLQDLLRGVTRPVQAQTTPTRLRWLRASQGEATRHIPVQEVLYLQSDDKYTIVHTAEGEHIVRMSIAEMIAALDPEQFWQVHRSIVVNMNFVDGTRRDQSGRTFVRLKDQKTELPVSRAWVHLFRQM